MDNIGKKFTPDQGRIRTLDVYSRDTVSRIFIILVRAGSSTIVYRVLNDFMISNALTQLLTYLSEALDL